MKYVFLILVLISSSCAKMINGSHQTIHIDNLPKDAVVIVSDDAGSKIATTPDLKLARSSPYTLHIQRPGFATKEVKITRTLSPLVISYALPGGLAMLAADSATHSQFNLVPARVNATLDTRRHGQKTAVDAREDMTTSALIAFRAVIKAALS